MALLAVVVTVAGLINSNWKDRKVTKKQLADEVRRAAALLIVKLERWRDLAGGLFEEIQPEITDADIRIVKGKDAVETRDLLVLRGCRFPSASVKRKSNSHTQVCMATIPQFANSF